jgi:hypothetical protein
MNGFKILGLILFYIGILGGFFLALFYLLLLFRFSRESGIKIKHIILVKQVPSGKLGNQVKRSIYYGKILITLFFLSIVLIIVGFLVD